MEGLLVKLCFHLITYAYQTDAKFILSLPYFTGLPLIFLDFQFNCTNTLPETRLENLQVAMIIESTEDANASLLKPDFLLPIETLDHNESKILYVVYRLPDFKTPVVANFSCTLKFTSKEMDPSTGEVESIGYPDEYLVMGRIFLFYFAHSWSPHFEKQLGEGSH